MNTKTQSCPGHGIRWNGRKPFVISSQFHHTTFYHSIKLCNTKLHKSFHIISLVKLKQNIYLCFEPKQSLTALYCQQQLVLFSHLGNFTAVQSFNLLCIAMHVFANVKMLKSLRDTRITSLKKNFWISAFSLVNKGA